MKKKAKNDFNDRLLIGSGNGVCRLRQQLNNDQASSPSPNAYRIRSAKPNAEASGAQHFLRWDIQNGFDDPDAKDDTIFNDLQKKLNVTVNPVQITWNDWQEKAKVWAASGQLPDIFPNAIATDNPACTARGQNKALLKRFRTI